MKESKKKGYVLLLAVLISSIILAMSMGIFAISIKEVSLATFARDSVRAFSAASRGLECAMFNDRINGQAALDIGYASTYYNAAVGNGRSELRYTPFSRGNPSNFAALTPPEDWVSGSKDPLFLCIGTTPTNYLVSYSATSSGITTFDLVYSDSCASVTVTKVGISTTFVANGYSDCNANNPRRTQRSIEVTVNL